ncbi:hypothetical protein L6452_26333 [Arctium lappa]|uniref:Uncharacterized protein n=1 Tax=Arctium lappa TaxID=4217 RepID=A0ACB9ACG3_ARCLA|nr:hypothetical protein L6452_26333 [Arctium lappa]
MSENGQREDPLIKPNGVDSDDDDTVCLGESFFIDDNYELTTFTFGSQNIAQQSVNVLLNILCAFDESLPCLDSKKHLWNGQIGESNGEMLKKILHLRLADFDLTGQLVWPGARLLNEYLSNNAEILQGCSAVELGSGVG